MTPLNLHRVALAGPWQVCPVSLDAEGLPEPHTFSNALTVPACTHLQVALYPDQPYWGAHIRHINEQAWVYRQTFPTPQLLFKRARLHFEGVDYFAEIWLNGQFIGRHEGHFAPFTYDVTKALNTNAENVLLVRVSAPWDRPNPRGNYPIDHVIRGLVKGQYEHGDGVIPPDVNPIGVWRPVSLLLDDGLSLDQARIRTQIDGTVDAQFTITNATGDVWDGTLILDALAENHDGPGCTLSIPVALPPGTHTTDQIIRIPDPRLWWPWDHGRPDLYRLNASLQDADGQEWSSLTSTFGLRTVRLERSPERFTYYINERPVYVRGASYMPELYLSRCTTEALHHDVTLARQANLNLLRLHIHVSPPELYDLCDRAGMLVWQDFELNWTHDYSAAFERRALAMQRDMINLLGNHPSILTWACHNEPTMVFTRRQNLEACPDPALYRDATALDPTRPVFLCSGQMESDWQRAGDIHSYYGAIWSAHYTEIYRHRARLTTEFGCDAPAALNTLRQYHEVWDRLDHVDGQIEALWAYQAALIQYQVEHFRRLRPACSAGFIYFWLVDLIPQIGCGVLDSCRQPKAGYDALRLACQPLHVALEHDGRRPCAWWVFNDTPHAYPQAVVQWEVRDQRDQVIQAGQTQIDVAPNASQQVMPIKRTVLPAHCAQITLRLLDGDGTTLSSNHYRNPFQPLRRPRGYPWKYDPILGTKVFDRSGAASLADQHTNPVLKVVPLAVREACAEWVLRQRLPTWFVSTIARLARPFVE
ncbi:MAG: beta galactosidase jelly roll domain-containing protein [Anaerolineae bacterium]|nr:beta galactosidase jelly roll domain-containing protein [Anaerolineae bacterium]